MNLFNIRASFAAVDATPMLLALLLAGSALALSTIVGGIVDAIAHEVAGLKEPIGRRRRFAEVARRPESVLLLVTAVGASHGVNWWIGVPLSLAGLLIARLPKYIDMWPRAVAIGAQWQVLLAVAGSTAFSVMSAVWIFMIGAWAGWLVR